MPNVLSPRGLDARYKIQETLFFVGFESNRITSATSAIFRHNICKINMKKAAVKKEVVNTFIVIEALSSNYKNLIMLNQAEANKINGY